MTDITTHPLWDAQIALEEEMRAFGASKFREAMEQARKGGKEANMAPGRKLMSQNHEAMRLAVEAFFDDVKAQKAGRKHSAYPYLAALDDVDLIAHLTSRIIIDTLSKPQTLLRVSLQIAEALEDELNYRKFREQNTPAYLNAAKRAKGTGNRGQQRRTVLKAAKNVGLNLTEWPKRDRIQVGSKLVELFMEATGLIDIVERQEGKRVEVRPEVADWVAQECAKSEWLCPVYLPTIVPPQPWTTPFAGGYWSRAARRLTLVKTPSKAYLKELEARDMPLVYRGVNALQSTAWGINRRVLGVMEELWENGSTLGILPSAEDEPLPPKPYWLAEGMNKDTMTPEQKQEFIAWKSEVTRVHEENAAQVGRRVGFSRMLWVARKFAGYDEFFYPYQLDWRGRAYPVGLYLQPQGNDAQRGLLEFSTTCSIKDQEGADWLAIHGAGLWGVDKCSFPERVAWVEENSAAILASAENPFDNRFWTTAEKPWQALAFCYDWAGFKREGFGYESSLPVQMDGTCNGLQNFSAILRDEIGGAAVNLVPGDKPSDIYSQVMELVKAQVEQDVIDGVEYAEGWMGAIKRKTVKRPVMTLAYGAKRYGFTNMIFEDTIKPWKAAASEKQVETYGREFPFGYRGFQAAQYLAGLIWEKVGEVVVAARAAMDWLQEAARVVAQDGLPVFWTTPTGLLVQQSYKVRKAVDVKLAFQTVRVRLKMAEDTDQLDTKRQASGVAPNWVHSLDASHMMLTICAAHDLGMQAFSFIHDSYGTHAGNCAALATLLREQFVRMYSECDVLAQFKADLEAVTGCQLPALPAKGNLDLEQVLESPFFFA